MDFNEMRRFEIDAAVYVSPYERWANRVEAILGFDLDGDQREDGYSLDWALDRFNEGATVAEFVKEVRASQAANLAGRMSRGEQ